MGNPFSSHSNDGPDTIQSKSNALPDFDIHSIYMGVEKLPTNNASRNDNAIGKRAWDPYENLTLPYKLPQPEISQPTGQSTLDDLNRRITEKATDTVQKRMTPQEKKDLNDDADKYAKQMEEYKEHMRRVMMGTGGIGLDDPPPNKPASLVKYERAIDAEIKKISQNLG
ncbi:MAG: hypothetical protein JST89_19435 [Cyanobacteria bacterium SZAS-4]|nr:hypothetical protein [Cyanobacteria bacterium SZAS-4]